MTSGFIMTDTVKNMLSICCLSYKHGAFIKDFLESFKNVKSDFEIIILDDGSPDNSFELIKKQASLYDYKIKLIYQENTGNIGGNFNRLARNATGEFITFIALDDCLYDGAIDKSLEILKSDEKLAFVAASKITPIDKNKSVLNDVHIDLKVDSLANPTAKDLLELEYSEFGSFYLQGTFIRREIFDSVNGFDEDLIGDDIIIRTKIYNYLVSHPEYSFKILHEPLCYYRFHDSNIHKNFPRQIRIVSEYLGRYWADRDIPKMLEDWYLYTTRNMSLKDTLNLALINSTAAKLLQKDRVISKIEKRIAAEHSLLRYFFYKKKIGNKRIIKLFSCISFSYSKK